MSSPHYPPITPTDSALYPGVVLANSDVCMDGVNPILIQFLHSLGRAHDGMFGTNAVVTSAKDKIHVASSKHYKGDAIDLRIADKMGRQQIAFILLLMVLADRYRCAVFDESNLPGQPHVHVEIAG
jgi:hypothetical protein